MIVLEAAFDFCLEFRWAAESVELGLGAELGIGATERMSAKKNVVFVANDVDSAANGDFAAFWVFQIYGHEFAGFAVLF